MHYMAPIYMGSSSPLPPLCSGEAENTQRCDRAERNRNTDIRNTQISSLQIRYIHRRTQRSEMAPSKDDILGQGEIPGEVGGTAQVDCDDGDDGGDSEGTRMWSRDEVEWFGAQ